MVTLGLDLGANSIGWALLDEEYSKIIDMGSKIFEAGVNDLNTGKEESRNAQRSLIRRARRTLERRVRRKKKLRIILREIGLMPKSLNEEYFSDDPYYLRKKALDEKLSLFENGRIFYHLCQRRGYKSNRKEQLSEKEKGTIFDGSKDGATAGIKQTIEEIEAGSFRTLGEYLCSLDPHTQRLRRRYTTRGMYEDEFNKIWEKQRQFYPEILIEKNYEKIAAETIFFQRKLKSQKKLIGFCPFEKKKRRAPRSSPLFQEFRMLQTINSLRIIGPDRRGDEAQKLNQKEREIIIDNLSSNDDITVEKLYKKIKLDPDKYKFNFKKEQKIIGLKTISKIKKSIGKDSEKLSPEEIFNIWHLIYSIDNKDIVLRKLMSKWGFTEEQAKGLEKIKLDSKYGNLSTKAMNKIIPYLREGQIYSDACLLAGYDHSLGDENIEILDELPLPENIRNPIVMVALHQLRRVVNAIIKRYGRPDCVKIEMARDMSLPKEKRVEIEKKNKDMEKKHDEIRGKLIEGAYVSEPSRNDLIKYKLWEECKHICPYTGKNIALNQLFGEAPEFQIEHIIPYSRSLDDSYMNKTLCYHIENIHVKKNKTPFEAYSGDKQKYSEILERVKHLPRGKYSKFVADEKKLEEMLDNFISRQLNDTSYISRVALRYLKHITEDVQVGKGQTTAALRYLWGLNSILVEASLEEIPGIEPGEKNRLDHRHHSIDALIVALTSRSIFQKLSKIFKSYGLEDDILKNYKKVFPLPWENFRNDVRFAVSNIIVSHKFKPKVSGQLHEETNYGRLRNPDGSWMTDEKGQPCFAVRKSLDWFDNVKKVNRIIDAAIRKTVLDRLEEKSVNIKKEKTAIPKDAFTEPLYLIGNSGKETLIKSARISVVSASMKQLKKFNLWVDTGNNHHLIIYIDEKGKIRSKTITLFEAYERKKFNLPIIDKNLGQNQEYITSLQINEMFMEGEPPENFNINDKNSYRFISKNIYRVQYFDVNGIIAFRRHEVSKLTLKTINENIIHPGRYFTRASVFNCNKIIVDDIGYIHYAVD